MSKKEKNAAEAAQQKTEKVMTKYDLKVQKRKEAEKKAKREALEGRIIGAVLILALVAFILYFPVKNYVALHSAYITVGTEKITRVEFDYNYALAKSSYLNSSEGSYLTLFGYDTDTIDTEQYSTTMTFGDYFDQLAVQNIINTKSLVAAAEEAGFTYDTDLEYDVFVADLATEAASAGVSVDDYVKASYGDYATLDRLEDIIRETLTASAFYEEKANELLPAEDEILAYYEADKASYDSVDYHMTIVEAELPTTNPDGSVPVDEDGNEVEYEPTEEEIETAMEEARILAEEAMETVAVDGEGYTNVTELYINGLVSDWMFDEERQPGDTYMARDDTYNRYLVVSFDGRYRDDEPTADLRVIVSTSVSAQTILDVWESGTPTEDSFIDLVSVYDEAGMESYGGLYEGLTTSSLPEGMADWAADASRVEGDTYALDTEDGTNYACYYVCANDPAWKIDIRSDLLSENLAAYLEELAEGWEVKEGTGTLAYLHEEEISAEAVSAE